MKKYICDMKKYKWNKDNFNILKSLLKQIFLFLYIAYKQYGFIHNDSHHGNFLLKKQKKEYIIYNYNNEEIKINYKGYSIVIMDFESSLFEKDRNSYNILCSDFISIINNIDSILKISTKNSNLINIYLLKLVDKLEYIEHNNIISNYEELLKNLIIIYNLIN
jgi:predicted unusual protein kinase regulating ubiquinone biosynthesis (AarF/ABC1/UbiB family)